MIQRIILNYKGKQVNGLRIKVVSVFPVNIQKIWNKIQDVETLRYIAEPRAQFEPIDDIPSQWKEGDSYNFRMCLYRFIPIGRHTIHVVSIDKQDGRLYTNEYNRTVKIWNHLITMEDTTGSVTRYTDMVDIYAGIFTSLVAWWSIKFYKHRQRKWQKIAKTL